ncbi:MAG: amidohydrolase family protein [Gammaproteobacteria bacterium]|nr:amidohydrolase family protein [Gammaproteobacteria bacterium]
MYDTLIRGGTLVDGHGGAPVTGDIALKDGRIAAVGGRIDGAAKETLDASGCIVTPGWVDVHTHYDGQATWDPLLDPSSWHGVTTVVMGNCGVGFAPVRPRRRGGLPDRAHGRGRGHPRIGPARGHALGRLAELRRLPGLPLRA